MRFTLATVVAALAAGASAQTYQRLGTCPTLGCVLPPDQSEFLPGQLLDLRVEVHAPVNGSEAAHDGKPDERFKVTIAKGRDGKPHDFAHFFHLEEPEIEKWDFEWYEDLFAEDAGKASVVNVASKAYRKLSLTEPGTYYVTLHYYDGETTTAEWTVRDISRKKKAKNAIFFIGDGMTTNMVSFPTRKDKRRIIVLTARSDHCRPSSGTQEHQRKVPVSAQAGRLPRAGPPDDTLDRHIHYRLGQLGLGSVHRTQGHCQRSGVGCPVETCQFL